MDGWKSRSKRDRKKTEKYVHQNKKERSISIEKEKINATFYFTP